jgi:Methyltransferase domain
MHLLITKKDRALVLIASLSLLLVAVLGRLFLGEVALIILPVLGAIVVLVVLLEVYRRLTDESRRRHRDYRQLEPVFSLYFTLKPSLPLPNMAGRTALPDLLKKTTERILSERPSFVMEAGSGVSTLVIAYCLQQLGRGKVISLEHDAKYAAITRDLLSAHRLEEIATIVLAPLKGFELKGQQLLWYDTDCVRIAQPIDLLFIDGPPGHTRYPALPLLYGHLNNKSTVILDDGYREHEKQVVAMWEEEFSHISVEFFNTAKGMYVIHKDDQAAVA